MSGKTPQIEVKSPLRGSNGAIWLMKRGNVQGSQRVNFSTNIFCLKNLPNVLKTVFYMFLNRFYVFLSFFSCFPVICSRFFPRFSPVAGTNSFFILRKNPQIDQKWDDICTLFVLALTPQRLSRWGPNLTKSYLGKPVFLA